MEYIKANDIEYKCSTVTTGINSISFVMEGQAIEDIHTAFKDVTELTVSGEDKTTYGIYENLSFVSATVNAENLVSVTMGIKSALEADVDALKVSQAEQDELLAGLMFGGEE